MKRQRLLVVMAVLAVTSASVAPALANGGGAQRIPVAWETSDFVFTAGEQTESRQVLIGRGVVGEGDVVGHDFLTGTGSFTLEYEFNLVTGEGTGHGTIEIASANYADSGWAGTFDIHYSDIDFITLPPPFGTIGIAWNSMSKPVMRGYGVFEGMTLRGIDTVTKGVPGHVAEGEILVPPSATVPGP